VHGAVIKFIDNAFFSRGVSVISRVAACLIFGLLVGCRGGTQGPPLAKVSGKVTYKGEPLANANVLFVPSKGRPAQGTTDQEGLFTLTTNKDGDGAAVGEHVIIVTKIAPPEGMSEQEFAEKQKSAGAGSNVRGKSAVPEKYTMVSTSPLKYTVTSGENKDVKVEITE
jgi:hypothetical protein